MDVNSRRLLASRIVITESAGLARRAQRQGALVFGLWKPPIRRPFPAQAVDGGQSLHRLATSIRGETGVS
jgi:hypothetical protein